jgi:HAD superfamily phosphoserine phosphatase-like hydrolase
MALLVLDLDGTLTKSDNLLRFSFFMTRRKLRFILFVPLLFLLKFKIISNEKFKKYYAHLILKDQDVSYIKNCAIEFTKTKGFLNDLNNDVFSYISSFRLSHSVIISSNFEFLVEPICEVLGIKDFRAVKLIEEDERFTGEILGVIPYGKTKVKVYDEYLQNAGIHPSIGLGDHASDLPLLKSLTQGFMVSFNKTTKFTRIISVNDL